MATNNANDEKTDESGSRYEAVELDDAQCPTWGSEGIVRRIPAGDTSWLTFNEQGECDDCRTTDEPPVFHTEYVSNHY